MYSFQSGGVLNHYQAKHVANHLKFMMKKKLVLHIGAGKCGSSAVQAFLSKNHKELLKRGILIPDGKCDLTDTVVGNQIWFLQDGVKKPDFDKVIQRRMKKLHLHMGENNLDTVVLSAENMINSDGFHSLFANLESIFDIRVVAYVRRQDDYHISAWQQWYLKQFESFEEYVDKRVDLADWHLALDVWATQYGRENIVVRVYEKEKLVNGNVVDDFMSVLSIPTDGMEKIEKRINRSIDEKYNRIANKHRQQLFKSIHDNEFYEFLVTSFGDDAFKTYRGSRELTLAQRHQLLKRYQVSNQNLYNDYLSDTEAQLSVFAQPEEKDCYAGDEKFPEDSSTDVLVLGMFGMYKRFNRIVKKQSNA